MCLCRRWYLMKNKISMDNQWYKQQPQKLLAGCYLWTAVVMLRIVTITSLLNLIAYKVGFYQQKMLNIYDFEHIGVEVVDDMTLINATNDTQLIYEGNIKNLYVKCNFSAEPGEFVAFYSKRNNYAFGSHQMVYAMQEGEYYVFRFPIGTKQVRIDTGVEPSITVSFDEIMLNKQSLREITGINTGCLFYLMICPMVLFSILYTGATIYECVMKKKK